MVDGAIGRTRQNAADRLNPISIAVIVNEGDPRRNGRSSAACARYADVPSAGSGQACAGSPRPVAVCGPHAPTPSPCQQARDARPLAAVDLRLLHPLMKRLRNAADLLRDRNYRPSGRVIPLVVEYQPHRALADIRRKLARRLALTGSPFSGVGASGKPVAAQSSVRACDVSARYGAIAWIPYATKGNFVTDSEIALRTCSR